MRQLSERCIRAGWEVERANIIQALLHKKFNPKVVEKVADNFIESMSFARSAEKNRHA